MITFPACDAVGLANGCIGAVVLVVAVACDVPAICIKFPLMFITEIRHTQLYILWVWFGIYTMYKN